MGADARSALAAALGELQLDAPAFTRLVAVLELLASDDRAPTTVREPAEAAGQHVADSLVALEVERLRAATAIADVGSGAGFPGLAVAAALPGADVRLVESQRRKCEFLERARAAAGLENVSVVCARVEDWREGLLTNDVVLARALAAQAVVLEYAAPLLSLGGTLIDWRGRREPQEEAAADRAASELGLERVEVRPVAPFPGVRDRNLHVFAKIAPTPARFPRRAGVAAKRPLGR